MDFSRVEHVIYHKNCNDGLSAACIFKSLRNDVTFTSFYYADKVEGYKNTTILFLDVSLRKETLDSLIADGNTIYVIDHHEPSKFVTSYLSLKRTDSQPHESYVDMDYCGAMLTWKKIYPDKPIPKMLEYVNDRDLWLNKMPYYNEVFQSLSMIDKTIDAWYNVIFHPNQEELVKKYIENGKVIKKKIDQQIEMLAKTAYMKKVTIKGKSYNVLHINSSIHQSDLGNYLAINNPTADFIAVYTINYMKKKYTTRFSLRGNGKHNLSDIASNYVFEGREGGGHFNASGCIVDKVVACLPNVK